MAQPLPPDEELSLIEHWLAQDGSGLPSRHAATVKLTALMHTVQQPVVTRRSAGLFAAGLLAAFAVGAGVARWTRPQPLLVPGLAAAPHVERKSSAEAQYVYALMTDTEDAWRSVPEYFPQQTYFARRAEQQLARLYLHEDDYPRALKLFEKFADMDDTEEDFRAFGLAGAAAVLTYQGHPRQAAEQLVELWPLRQHLDPQTKSWIVQLLAKTGRQHHDTTLQKWDDWLKPKAATN